MRPETVAEGGKPAGIWVALAILALPVGLAACGGGGGSSGSPPSAPESVSLDYDIKTLVFSWPAVAGATHYRLYENPDGISGYSLVVDNITDTTVRHAIALYRRVNARYMIAACNAVGCNDSHEIVLSDHLIAAIGYVKASNTGESDNFGYAVALSSDGSTLAVGAPGEDSAAKGLDCSDDATDADADADGIPDCQQNDGTADDSGAVYVFTRGEDGLWTQRAYVKASNAGEVDEFGRAVALSENGDTLAVGAWAEDSAATGINGDQTNNGASDAGAVYVFTREEDTWTQQAYVKASNAEAWDGFGYALSLSADGSTLAVGAPYEDSGARGVDGDEGNNSAGSAGAVYVFTREGDTWTQQAYVKASNAEKDEQFGAALALSENGDTLAVGAWPEDSAATGVNCDGDATDADDNGIPDCQEEDDTSKVERSGAVYLY